MSSEAHEGPSVISRDWRVRLALYAATLFAYLAAGARDPLTPFQLGVFAIACVWSLLLEHRYTRPFFSTPLKILLILVGSLIFVTFIGGHLNRAPDSFANAIARFLFWNAIVFILSRGKSEYDVWTLGIIILSLFMIAGAFVQPAAFVPLFAASLVALLYGFQRLALLRCGPAGEQTRGGWGLTLTQALVVLEVAAIVFVFFPRRLFWEKPADPADAATPEVTRDVPTPTEHARTGLPRTPGALRVGQLASVKVDPTAVLTLRVALSATGDSEQLGRDIYLRQDVLVDYSGGGVWNTRHRIAQLEAGDDGQITRAEFMPLGRQRIFQVIQFTPVTGQGVPALAEVYEIGIARLGYDDHGVFLFAAPLPREYRVVSYLPPSDAERRASAVTEVVSPSDHYVRRPLVSLGRLAELAKRIAGDKGTVLEKVRALRAHFAGFKYTLTPSAPPAGADVYDHFVIDGRAGYCTHFAGALALMCRAAGLPARVATGLHLGKEAWDPFNKRYVGRNSDAHAWTEVWLGREHGWLPFDATPAEGMGVPAEGAPVATGDTAPKGTAAALDAETRRWDDAILNYDPRLQGRALSSVSSWIGGAFATLLRFLTAPVTLAVLLAALVIVGIVYLLLPRAQQAKLRQIIGGFKERSTIDFYGEFLWLCSKRGLRKPAGMTGIEFATVASTRLPAAAADFITKLFYGVKYGGRALSAEESLQVREVLKQIEAHAQAKS